MVDNRISVEHKAAIIFSIISALINGFAPLLTKLAIISFKNPILLTSLRWGITSILFITFGMIFNKPKDLLDVLRKKWYVFAILGIGFGITATVYNVALQYTTSVKAGLIGYVRPVLGAVLGMMILKESKSIGKFLSIPLLIIGILLISDLTNISGLVLGDALVVLWAIVSSLSQVISKHFLNKDKEKILSPFAMAAFPGLFTFIFTMPIASSMNGVWENVTITWQGLLGLIGLSVLIGCVFYWLQWYAVSRIELSLNSWFSYITPVFSVVLGCVILNESVTLHQILGAIVIVGSIFVATNKKLFDKKANR